MPRLRRGLLAGLAVVALGALGLYLFSGGEATSSSLQKKGRGRIKEVAPAKAPSSVPVAKSSEEGNKAAKPAETKPYLGRSPTDSTPPATIRRGPLQRYEESLKTSGPPIFDNEFDRLLANYAVPGQQVPPFPMTPNFKDAFMRSVADKIVIRPDDPPEVVELKESVSAMRDDLKAYLKEGGTVEDFMKKLQDRQDRESYFVNEAHNIVDEEFEKTGDIEGSLALWRKMNEKLVADGMRGTELPAMLRRALKRNNMEIPEQ